jgi:hypothetical protein
MSTLSDIDLYQSFVQLPNNVKAVVADIIEKNKSASDKIPVTAERSYGWAKGKIIMHDDFDEPMDDFKEYM